ncbi:MAG: ABC transporter ATP-binding protein [Anaerolineales bacterium]
MSWWGYLYSDASGQRPQAITRDLLWRVVSYAAPYRWRLGLMFINILVTTGLAMVTPLALRHLIDNVLVAEDASYSDVSIIAFILVLAPLLTSAINIFQRWLNASVGEGVIYDLRRQLFDHLQRMSLRFYVSTKTGELMSRLNNDVVGAQRAINDTFVGFITNLITVIGVLIVMFTLEWRLTLAGLIIVPLIILPARYFATRLRQVVRATMNENARMNGMMNETLNVNGIMIIKLFGRWEDTSRQFEGRAAQVRDFGVRQAVLGSAFFALLGLVSAFGTAVVYWLGGTLVLEGALTLGTVVAFAALLNNLYPPLQALVNAPVELASSLVSFERVFEVLDFPLEITEKSDATRLPEVQGRITFEDVTFSYMAMTAPSLSTVERYSSNREIEAALSDAPIKPSEKASVSQARENALDQVSFTVEPGELMAIVGPSGAGKTTITYLLPRLYDPTSGHIRLDGHCLADLRLSDLARHIGMVTQETFLFHDTIRTNLLYAKPDATAAELDNATRAANIYDFIQELPDGYDTIVGERGYRLSGGEKQRLSIARIILKNPRILVLDEATSHLDSESEALIQQALEQIMHDRTSFVIAHRLSTILAADKIFVMNQGRLVEHGTHQALLAQDGLYARLYHTQFAEDIADAPA